MKQMNKGPARRIRLRAVVAYPAVSVAFVAAIALALTPFGPSQGVALAASSIPMETATVSATATDTSTPTASVTTAPTATYTTSPTPSPSSGTVAASGDIPVDHHVLARIEGSDFQASYLPIDAIVPDASQFQTFRVRFKFHNDGTDPMTATPRLEYRADGGSVYVVVPDEPKAGVPFHLAREWVPSLGLGGGTMQGPLGEDIAVGDFRTGNEGGGLAVAGHHSMGANPDQPVTLPAGAYTEEEFTVTLSIDAQYVTGYELRITDVGTPLSGTDVATIRLGESPAALLSPGQRQGIAVVDPKPASTSAGAAYPLLAAQSIVANTTTATAVSVVTATYPLIAGTLTAAAAATDGIHGPYSMTTDECARCHRAHTAQAPSLVVKSGSQSALCFECHGGGSQGANTDVESQYTGLAPLVNNADLREYYSHDAVGATTPVNTHTRSELDEFGGVSNRHSECADCHNSHKANANTDSTQIWDESKTPALSTGWSASGRLDGVSGVSVVNGAAGTAPTYTFLSGVPDLATGVYPVTREYQLCFKCHSGFTKLLTPILGKPSTDALDKGVEFNPANASFHPVEAAGKNDTSKMTLSLTGTSPYKLWNFTINSTIRCLNCHASGSTPGVPPPPLPLPGDASLPLPGSSLAPHTSSNRGILLRNYRDRVLKSTNEAYSEGDFALCYVCHGEEPFKNSTGTGATTATNFSLHGKHLTLLAGKGDGTTNIDTAGAGQGNAICAECHFRIHSTTNKVGVVGGSRLVSFAPNVVEYVPDTGSPVAEPITWTPGAASGGSCTLTCHLHKHKNAPY